MRKTVDNKREKHIYNEWAIVKALFIVIISFTLITLLLFGWFYLATVMDYVRATHQ
ncbi:MAG TPA: hypothetical protein VL093_05150 [Flavipsychrobacter sp.]|nr:hypothetical protein [Flavipsychrobacter sp.]